MLYQEQTDIHAQFRFDTFEDQVISLYDEGVLKLPVLSLSILDILANANRGFVMSNENDEFPANDGSSIEKICVMIVNPEFIEENHWHFEDEFEVIVKERWGWQ